MCPGTQLPCESANLQSHARESSSSGQPALRTLIGMCLALTLLGLESTAAAQNSGLPPGAKPFDSELLGRLKKARGQKPSSYKPRTKHLNDDGSATYTNRLMLETSPYLLQHAHNPVNWYAWTDEAFAAAKQLDRPVLLSIGYSTCHWCHVMEEESFEDPEIARFMNENYIAIKVDREERPDVDSIYMAAVQALTGRGGWPMTVWLTPERAPFYGGTYFPARDGDRGAKYGFLTVLQKLRQVYSEEGDKVAQSAAQLTRAIEQQLTDPQGSDTLPTANVMHTAAQRFERAFDPVHGGTSGAPKFPSSLSSRFLLRYHRRTGSEQALNMALLTLDKMAAGGMYDQIGGGFHRYSTDEQWLVPHFEKMLYDNALLVLAYLEAFQVTGATRYADVVHDILKYVSREMTSPQGAFYSATDADSLTPQGHRDEGYFFTWTPAELNNILGPKKANIVSTFYGVTPKGNFEGRSIMSVPKSLEETAKQLGKKPKNIATTIKDARAKLYAKRLTRPQPLLDDKILTAWNGLMISAYARAGLTLNRPDYARQAARAAEFLLTNALHKKRLRRSFKDGQSRLNAYLDDYAFLIAGLLDVFEATGEQRWLKAAINLDSQLEIHYEDKKLGAFFMTSDDHEKLLVREKPIQDGAIPSGNSLAVMNLLRLSELTTKPHYRRRAERLFRLFAGTLERSPTALSEMLLSVDFLLDRPKEVVIVTKGNRDQAAELLREFNRVFLPNRTLAVVQEQTPLGRLVPWVKERKTIKGKPTAYVCEQMVCKLPTTDPVVFAKQLNKSQSLAAQPSPATEN